MKLSSSSQNDLRQPVLADCFFKLGKCRPITSTTVGHEVAQKRLAGAEILPAVALRAPQDSLAAHSLGLRCSGIAPSVNANVSVRMWSAMTRYAVSFRSSSLPVYVRCSGDLLDRVEDRREDVRVVVARSFPESPP